MLLKSQLICPKESRVSASKEDLLKALDAAEKQLNDIFSNPTAKVYVSLRDNMMNVIGEVDEIFKQAKSTGSRVLNGEDKTFDKIQAFWKATADYDDVLEKLRKKTTPEDILEAEKQQQGTQSIVALVRDKKSFEQESRKNGKK